MIFHSKDFYYLCIYIQKRILNVREKETKRQGEKKEQRTRKRTKCEKLQKSINLRFKIQEEI